MLSSWKKTNACCWSLYLKCPLPLPPTLAQSHSKLHPVSLESSSSLFSLYISSWIFLKSSLDTLVFKIFYLIIFYMINSKFLIIENKIFKNMPLTLFSVISPSCPWHSKNSTERKKKNLTISNK